MKPRITVVFVIGILCGGLAVEAGHIFRDGHRHEVFEERLRCKALAEAYVKGQSEEPYTMLERVDFSPSRNSCIAAIHKVTFPHSDQTFNVVDVISGEVLSHSWCAGDDETSKSYCGNGKNISLRNEYKRGFEKTVGSFW